MTEYAEILRRLDRIEKVLRPTKGMWLTESEAMLLTDLSKRTLRRRRKEGVFNWSNAGGKIKYLRKDVEAYLNNNSTLKN